MLCELILREWRNLQFNIDSERQIFEKLIHGRFIYTQSFCQQSAEEKSPKKYFVFFVYFGLMPDLPYEAGLYV